MIECYNIYKYQVHNRKIKIISFVVRFWGTYKVRNEIETKRNEINENETKRNETKRNQQKRNETKRNQRNENETNEINENKTKYDARLLPTHVSVSFTRRGQDLITIEQEYYAFIQRESVLFT